MHIQDLTADTREAFIGLCKGFYTSNAVLHPIPDACIEATADEVLSGGPFARGLIFSSGEDIAGYALLSFTYSNEVGGMVVLVEEIFIKEIYRGKGYAREFFCWLFENYDGKAKRYRLEVSRENEAVCKLYSSVGFSELGYLQMIADRC